MLFLLTVLQNSETSANSTIKQPDTGLSIPYLPCLVEDEVWSPSIKNQARYFYSCLSTGGLIFYNKVDSDQHKTVMNCD